MKVKSLAALLTAFVLLFALAACGGGAEEPASATTTGPVGLIDPAPEQAKENLAPRLAAPATTEEDAEPDSVTEAATATIPDTKAVSATKAATTRTVAAASGKTKWEIDIAGIASPAKGAKLLRAWKAEQNDVTVEAYRLEYGARHDTSGSSGSAKVVNVQPVITVAVIHASPEHLYTTTAQQAVGKPLSTVEPIAKATNALIGINVAYWYNSKNPRFVIDCPVVVGGELVQAGKIEYPSLNIYKDGTWEFANISPANVSAKMAAGLIFNVVDQHVPIQNGLRTYTWGYNEAKGVQEHNGGDNEPYAFFGQIDKDTYIMATGEFMNRNDMVDVLLACGTQTALELNGGNSAMLYLQGVGNAPNPNTAGKSLKGLNKLNMTDNEHQYLLGIFGGEGLGGTNATIDFVYFK